jgi:hypothetical protein
VIYCDLFTEAAASYKICVVVYEAKVIAKVARGSRKEAMVEAGHSRRNFVEIERKGGMGNGVA